VPVIARPDPTPSARPELGRGLQELLDVSFVAISRAPYPTIQAYRKRMAWRVKWLSSFNNDFNHDYHVTFTPEEQASGQAYYNYTNGPSRGPEPPGVSVTKP
jgi:predicted dithiol-disulfide oxidoreductase (DUF899 family)